MAQPATITVDQAIDQFWQWNVQRFDFSASHRIEVNDTLKAIIEDEGISIIAARLR